MTKVGRRSPRDRAALRASPIGCCDASATSPRYARAERSIAKSPLTLYNCSKSISLGSTTWTRASSRPSSRSSTAGRSASAPSPPRSAKTWVRSRKSTSRSSSRTDSCSALRADGSPPRRRIGTLGSIHPVEARTPHNRLCFKSEPLEIVQPISLKKRRPHRTKGLPPSSQARFLRSCAVVLSAQVKLVNHREEKDRQGDVQCYEQSPVPQIPRHPCYFNRPERDDRDYGDSQKELVRAAIRHRASFDSPARERRRASQTTAPSRVMP